MFVSLGPFCLLIVIIIIGLQVQSQLLRSEEASGVIPSLNTYYPGSYKLVDGVHIVVLYALQLKPLMQLYVCTNTHSKYKCMPKTPSLSTHIAFTTKLDR